MFNQCPICGGVLPDGGECLDHFSLMGIWELDHQLYDLHHLMVLCYYLQHPQLYSREGLAGALALLRRFAVDGAYVVDVREQMRPSVQQGTRTYPITARPDNVGVYSQPVVWTMTAGDVVAGGVEQYYENIRAWTGSVVGALRAAGVMD